MRVIEQKVWNTQKFRKKLKDINLRYLWLYLLTCPLSKTCGIFYLPIENIALETRLSESDINTYLAQLTELGMIEYNYETEEIIIYNFPKYNIVRLGKPMLDCLRSELSAVKDTNLIKKMITYIQKYIEYRPNDKKNAILSNILDIYNKSITITNSISITITNESWHDTEKEINWDELMAQMED